MAVDQVSGPSFLIYGSSGSGVHTALKAYREFQYLTMAGVSTDGLEQALSFSDQEQKPVAIGLALNPYEILPLDLLNCLTAFKEQHPQLKFLYLSCPTELLIQRYAKAEKSHPYEKVSLIEAIEVEQLLYQTLKPLSDYHIDTSTTSNKELTLKIAKILNIQMEMQPMTITLTSFGFKHGVPLDAEMVFDMRFLPNPFYEETLRPKTGLDQEVIDYVFQFPQTQAFLTHWQNLLAESLPLYQQQGKNRLNIAIGCTGGQHRSVAMTSAISQFLQTRFPDFKLRVVHREQNHWPQQAALPQR